VGPAAFTSAWLIAGLRQSGYPVAHEHISGLAALDADHPTVMIAGFLLLGACTTVFAAEVHRALGGRGRAGAAPWLLGAAGLAGMAAGVLRRDTVLLHPPGRPDGWVPSWHNDAHDLAAGVAYAAGVIVPLLLARRFRHDAVWARWRRPALAVAAVQVVLLVGFATDVDRSGNGLLQRVMVTVPQLVLVVMAFEALREERRAGGAQRRPAVAAEDRQNDGGRRSRSARTPSA
jgi:hypothetical protein